MIGTRQQLARAGNVVIQIGDDMIHPTNALSNLGFFYDKYMKNTTHVNSYQHNNNKRSTNCCAKWHL